MPSVFLTQRGEVIDWQVTCTCCWVKSAAFKTRKEVVEAWNTRAQPDILTTIRQYAEKGWTDDILSLLDSL